MYTVSLGSITECTNRYLADLAEMRCGPGSQCVAAPPCVDTHPRLCAESAVALHFQSAEKGAGCVDLKVGSAEDTHTHIQLLYDGTWIHILFS